MPVDVPFTGFYSKAMREALPCLSGAELMVFIAIASFTGEEGTAYPGVRTLAQITNYSTTAISALLKTLEAKEFVICLRKNERDPITHVLVPDVYAVNPALIVVSKPFLWQENRFRHASMPESLLTEEFAQADRITEAESEKQKQQSRITAPEGTAALQNANARVDMRNGAKPGSKNAGADSTAGSANAPDSPRSAYPPPSSAPSPSNLSLTETMTINSVRRKVPDMGHEVALQLVKSYGVDQFIAAVMAYDERNRKKPILRPTGWIIRNLQSGAKAR